MSSHGIATVNILCLYCVIWPSGSVVPSSIFMVGMSNFFGISTMPMASTKGESAKLLAELFLTSAGTPGIIQIISSNWVNH